MATSHVQILVEFTKKLPGIFTCSYFSATLCDILVTLREASLFGSKGELSHIWFNMSTTDVKC